MNQIVTIIIRNRNGGKVNRKNAFNHIQLNHIISHMQSNFNETSTKFNKTPTTTIERQSHLWDKRVDMSGILLHRGTCTLSEAYNNQLCVGRNEENLFTLS